MLCNENEKFEKDVILFEIGIGKINWLIIEDKLLNEYIILGFVILVFFILFLDGKGDLINLCLYRDVFFNERIKYLLKFVEIINGKFYFRFVLYFRFLYWVLNMI